MLSLADVDVGVLLFKLIIAYLYLAVPIPSVPCVRVDSKKRVSQELEDMAEISGKQSHLHIHKHRYFRLSQTGLQDYKLPVMTSAKPAKCLCNTTVLHCTAHSGHSARLI